MTLTQNEKLREYKKTNYQGILYAVIDGLVFKYDDAEAIWLSVSSPQEG